jgi:hypothetical protein
LREERIKVNKKLMFNRFRISVWDDENFLELDGGVWLPIM